MEIKNPVGKSIMKGLRFTQMRKWGSYSGNGHTGGGDPNFEQNMEKKPTRNWEKSRNKKKCTNNPNCNSDQSHVVKKYLGLVERKGTRQYILQQVL